MLAFTAKNAAICAICALHLFSLPVSTMPFIDRREAQGVAVTQAPPGGGGSQYTKRVAEPEAAVTGGPLPKREAEAAVTGGPLGGREAEPAPTAPATGFGKRAPEPVPTDGPPATGLGKREADPLPTPPSTAF